MPAKATIADLKDLGFTPEQFRRDGATIDAYLQAVLDPVGVDVRTRAGPTLYDNATAGVTFERLRQAEKYFAAAELWRRRKAFFEASAQAVNAETSAGLIAAFERNAREAETAALAALALISGTTTDTALSVGHVETGLYSRVGG